MIIFHQHGGCIRFSMHSDLKACDSKRSAQTRDIRAPPTSGRDGLHWGGVPTKSAKNGTRRSIHPQQQFAICTAVLRDSSPGTKLSCKPHPRRLMSLPLLYYVHGVSPSVPQWLPINFRTISSLVEKLLGNQMGAAREHPPKSNNFRPWH